MKYIAWMFALTAVAAAMIASSYGQTPATATSGPAQPPSMNRDGLATYRNLEYAKVDGNLSLLLDLYVPKSDKPLPLVVWIHGGAWQMGNKDNCPAMAMTRHGYAAASIDYRLCQQAVFPAQIHDCKGAIRFLRANAAKFNLDPNRIGVWGASAGGHLAALLGTTAGNKELEGAVGDNEGVSSEVQAVCDFFGPSDFISFADANLPIAEAATSPLTRLLGGPVSKKRELAALASPVTHASKNAAPFLIMHGDKDTTVPLQQSQALHKALQAAGAESTLKVIPGAGHGFGGADIALAVAAFFDKHLNPAAATSRPGSHE